MGNRRPSKFGCDRRTNHDIKKNVLSYFVMHFIVSENTGPKTDQFFHIFRVVSQ